MCNIVLTPNGEIDNVKDFLNHFDIDLLDCVLNKMYSKIEPNSCLCVIDLDATFQMQNIPYLEDGPMRYAVNRSQVVTK